MRRIGLIVFVLICVWVGAANGSYASVVSFAKEMTGYFEDENCGNTSDVSKSGQTVLDYETRIPYSRYADDGVELRFFEIRNIDFRLFLLYRLTQDERFELNAENENGIFILYSSNGNSGDDFFDTFEEFYNNSYADFQLLTKVDIAEFFPVWKSNVVPRHLMSIMMDITLDRSRSGNDHCINADPFCTSDQYHFASAFNDIEADENADFGCVSLPRNPSWYYMRIYNSGSFVIHMEGHDPNDPNTLLDIDFCLWGPFTQQQIESGYACSHLTTDKIIDCSYSTAGVEDAYLGYYEPDHTSHYGSSLADGNITYHVPQSGEYYLMMITNFSNLPCTIDFNYASGSGSTDCNIVTECDNTGPYCVGDTIELTINSVLGATYYWTHLATGFTSNLQNPIIPNCTMADGGVYLCTVSVGGQSVITSTTVEVYPQPNANFTATTVCQGTATQFTSTSTTNPSGQSISSYQWDFGDGQTGSGQNTTHVYATPGTYQATLMVSTGNGHCTDQITHTVTVNPQPTAGFSATTACLGEATQFTNTSTGQSIISTQWNFGDGQGSTVQNPTHTYAQAGTYNVTLTVQAQGGCTSQITQTITVNPQPTAGFTATTVCQGEATQFISTSTGQSIVSYQWNFGDGQTGSGQNVSHTFAQAGTYNVTLTVQAQGGCTSQITQTVTVNPTLEVTIEVDGNTAICDGDTVTLNAVVEFSYVAVGDILCTDGTFVKQDAWPVQGKTAKAVVFYVDDTKAHGWAVSLTQTSNKAWSTLTNMVIATHPNWRDAITDFNGYSNTQTLRNGTSATTYPAAWAVDFSNGWYLPAAGQLNMLYGELPEVNRSLNLITDAMPIVDNNPGTTRPGGSVLLWSSTEGSQASEAMAVEIADGCVAKVNKTSSDKYYVRAVISF